MSEYIPKCDQCGRFTTNPETTDAYQPGPGSAGPMTTRLCDTCAPPMPDTTKQPLTDEMISRLHDWFEIPTKAVLYQAVSNWLASVKSEAWHEGYTAGASWNDGTGEYFSRDDNPYGAADTTKDAY